MFCRTYLLCPNEQYATDVKVVEEIFGDSIHREVVGRSSKLLRFLSTMEGALTTEHLDLIWMSCVGKAEPELQVSLSRKYGLFEAASVPCRLMEGSSLPRGGES